MKFCGSSKYLAICSLRVSSTKIKIYLMYYITPLLFGLEPLAQPVNTQLCGTMMPLHCFTVWPVQICAKSAMTKNLV